MHFCHVTISWLLLQCSDTVWLFFVLGDVGFVEIDQFTFEPGPHILIISFNLTSGENGTFEYAFNGEVRERKS